MKTATHLQQEAAEVVALGGSITIYNRRREQADGAPKRCGGRDGVVRTAEVMPAFRQVLRSSHNQRFTALPASLQGGDRQLGEIHECCS